MIVFPYLLVLLNPLYEGVTNLGEKDNKCQVVHEHWGMGVAKEGCINNRPVISCALFILEDEF